jgi:hypothetical protein
VVQHLPSKPEALSSNTSTSKRKRKVKLTKEKTISHGEKLRTVITNREVTTNLNHMANQTGKVEKDMEHSATSIPVSLRGPGNQVPQP